MFYYLLNYFSNRFPIVYKFIMAEGELSELLRGAMFNEARQAFANYPIDSNPYSIPLSEILKFYPRAANRDLEYYFIFILLNRLETEGPVGFPQISLFTCASRLRDLNAQQIAAVFQCCDQIMIKEIDIARNEDEILFWCEEFKKILSIKGQNPS